MDRLNNIRKYEPIDYEEYFSVMNIPEEDIEKRVELAEEIDDIYFNLFALILSMVVLDEAVERDYLYGYVEERISEVTSRYGYPYLAEYAHMASLDAVDVTLDHLGEEYYTSDERASRLAAENAQTIANYSELQDAIEEGYTHKTWVAELDRRTRDEHREMNGKTIPIAEFFHFSDCDMLCPHDEVYGSGRQCANCRCSLDYKKIGDMVENAENNDKIEENKDVVIPGDKVVGYLLNPQREHYGNFIEAGYDQDHPEVLVNDLAERFDFSSRTDVEEKDGGAIQFVQIMTLGVGKERTFRTVWRKDQYYEGSPRLITAYRVKKND